jgi:hypothetical protein
MQILPDGSFSAIIFGILEDGFTVREDPMQIHKSALLA